jgi:hypothetical protein
VVQDLPDRGGSDRVAEPDELAWHVPQKPVQFASSGHRSSLASHAAMVSCPTT